MARILPFAILYSLRKGSVENGKGFIFVLLKGELAQLARALAWHARGHRFDSGILHDRALMIQGLFLFPSE